MSRGRKPILPWTTTDDETIQAMRRERQPIRDIAAAVNRPEWQVQARLLKLGVKLYPAQPWRRLLTQPHRLDELAAQTGRGYHSIRRLKRELKLRGIPVAKAIQPRRNRKAKEMVA